MLACGQILERFAEIKTVVIKMLELWVVFFFLKFSLILFFFFILKVDIFQDSCPAHTPLCSTLCPHPKGWIPLSPAWSLWPCGPAWAPDPTWTNQVLSPDWLERFRSLTCLGSLCFCFCCVEVKFVWHKIYHFKVCDSVVFSTFTVLCNHCHYLIEEHFHHPKGNSIPINGHSQFSPPPALGNH